MVKNKIIPIVLHRVVNSICVNFEDITVKTLKKILNKRPNSYITIEDSHKKFTNSAKLMYLVTFDDGYISDYKIVFPLLKSLGIRATFFINTSNVGKSGFLNWGMIIEMIKEGNVFGSHGHNHLKMTSISLQAAKYEFLKSKELYELKTGKSMQLFSFPFGDYNNRLIKLSMKCGYTNCFISRHGVINHIGNIIPRNSINSNMDDIYIDKILSPTIITFLKWAIEDVIKYIVKIVFGDKYYKIIRRKILDII